MYTSQVIFGELFRRKWNCA